MKKEVTAKVKRLRRMSMRELGGRSRQELLKFGERFLNVSVGEMSDLAFLRAVRPDLLRRSALETSEGILARIRASVQSECSTPTFFPSFGHQSEIATTMARRFPREQRALLRRARRSMNLCFDLLGFTDIHYNGEIDWRLEPISGKRTTLTHWSRIDYLDPEVAGDKKITWELNRHGHFVSLGQAYWMTGDERYAQAFFSQAISWMDANPPGCGINWASSLEIALRSVAWLWALHLVAGSRGLVPEFTLRLLKHLVASGRHVERYLSRYFSPNTHLTGEALGLLYLGVALPELKEASRWRESGIRILTQQLPLQVRSDGVYFEQATYYHRYTADFYLHFAVLARAVAAGWAHETEGKIAQLLDHLMWITRPDGSSPLVGDDDGGRLIALGERSLDDFRDTLAIGATLFGRGDWKWVAGDAPAEVLWLLGPDGLRRYDEMASEPPAQQCRAFDAAGYYVIRDGWSAQSSYALIDCGPHGSLACGHSHSDALSFEFAAFGKTWLVDPGTFTYTADRRWREMFRATSAHNTACVDNHSQSAPSGPFSWEHVARAKVIEFVPNGDVAWFKGQHDGYQRLDDPVTHTRSLAFVSSRSQSRSQRDGPIYLLVRDTFEAQGAHRYSISYHLSPGCTALANGSRVSIADAAGHKLTITAFGSGEAEARITQQWVSRCYGRREAAPVANFEFEASGPQEFTTFIVPSEGGGELAFISEHESAAARAFQISCGTTLDVILISETGAFAKCGPLAASGSFAWGRFVNERLSRACLIGGTSLVASEGFAFNAGAHLRQCSIRRDRDRVEVLISEVKDQMGSALGEAATIRIDESSFEIGEVNSVVLRNQNSAWKMVNAR